MPAPDQLDSLLLDLLSAWQRERDAGRAPDLEQLCGADAALRPELERRLQAMLRVEALAQRMEDTASLRPEGAFADTMSTAVLPPAAAPGDHAQRLPQVPGFVLERELGRGGMGVVYLASQERLGRRVALKMVLGAAFANADSRARFQDEAKIVAALRHPHIVQVHEANEVGGQPYFALEYLEGGALNLKLREQTLTPAQAAELVEKLARGMHYAHQQGVVHRDLKPHNVLLSVEGEPKIADFGLAKQADAGRTATGAAMGTPSYMAPEQADDTKNVGPAADIYALGAILYECLTGRPPFRGASVLDVLDQVRKAEPASIRALQPETPKDLETICLKCLQKEPAKRYASAEALAEDLRRFRAGDSIAARPIGAAEKALRWTKRNPTVATLAGAVAALLVLGSAASLSLALWAWAEQARADQKATLATANASLARERAAEAAASERSAQENAVAARSYAEKAEHNLKLALANEAQARRSQAEAEAQKLEADRQRQRAEREGAKALANFAEAEKQRTEAERLRQLAEARMQEAKEQFARAEQERNLALENLNYANLQKNRARFYLSQTTDLSALGRDIRQAALRGDFDIRFGFARKKDGSPYLTALPDRDCSIAIWQVLEGGACVLLFPNELETDNRLRKGECAKLLSLAQTRLAPVDKAAALYLLACEEPWRPFSGHRLPLKPYGYYAAQELSELKTQVAGLTQGGAGAVPARLAAEDLLLFGLRAGESKAEQERALASQFGGKPAPPPSVPAPPSVVPTRPAPAAPTRPVRPTRPAPTAPAPPTVVPTRPSAYRPDIVPTRPAVVPTRPTAMPKLPIPKSTMPGGAAVRPAPFRPPAFPAPLPGRGPLPTQPAPAALSPDEVKMLDQILATMRGDAAARADYECWYRNEAAPAERKRDFQEFTGKEKP